MSCTCTFNKLATFAKEFHWGPQKTSFSYTCNFTIPLLLQKEFDCQCISYWEWSPEGPGWFPVLPGLVFFVRLHWGPGSSDWSWCRRTPAPWALTVELRCSGCRFELDGDPPGASRRSPEYCWGTEAEQTVTGCFPVEHLQGDKYLLVEINQKILLLSLPLLTLHYKQNCKYIFIHVHLFLYFKNTYEFLFSFNYLVNSWSFNTSTFLSLTL